MADNALNVLGTVNGITRRATPTAGATKALTKIFPNPTDSKTHPELVNALKKEGYDLTFTVTGVPFVKPYNADSKDVFKGMDLNGDKKVTGQELLDGSK